MKNLALAVLLLPGFAAAQSVNIDKKVLCGNTETIISQLAKTYREQPIFIGQKPDSSVVVYANSLTTTWTVAQFNQQTACILETGLGFKFKPEVLGTQAQN